MSKQIDGPDDLSDFDNLTADDMEAGERDGYAGTDPPEVVPFTDAERAEVARITRELVAAVAAARDALDRLPWASAVERDAAVSRIIAKLPALVRETPHAAERQLPRTPVADSYHQSAEEQAAWREIGELQAAAIAAERGEATVDPDPGQHEPVRIGTLTIGYIERLDAGFFAAYNSDFTRVGISADPGYRSKTRAFLRDGEPVVDTHGTFDTRGLAKRAIERHFAATVRSGVFDPKGA